MEKYQLDLERYKKRRLRRSFKDLRNRGWEEIKIEEIWFETSLPIDIILEAFNAGVNIPSEVKDSYSQGECDMAERKSAMRLERTRTGGFSTQVPIIFGSFRSLYCSW